LIFPPVVTLLSPTTRPFHSSTTLFLIRFKLLIKNAGVGYKSKIEFFDLSCLSHLSHLPHLIALLGLYVFFVVSFLALVNTVLVVFFLYCVLISSIIFSLTFAPISNLILFKRVPTLPDISFSHVYTFAKLKSLNNVQSNIISFSVFFEFKSVIHFNFDFL
jgi:hypothetical protein